MAAALTDTTEGLAAATLTEAPPGRPTSTAHQRQRRPSAVCDGLNVRQAQFVALYARNGGNGRAAAIAAGYGAAGADVHACRMLADPKIASAVQSERDRLAAAVNYGKADACRDMATIAQSDPRTEARIKAAALLGRWLGWEAPTEHHDVVDVRVLLDRLSGSDPRPLIDVTPRPAAVAGQAPAVSPALSEHDPSTDKPG